MNTVAPPAEVETFGVKLNRVYRVFATALCFTVYGTGGVLMGVVFFPLLLLLYRERLTRRRAARTIVRVFFRLFVEMMRLLGVLTYELHGMEKLDRRGLFILANHPSLLDVVFLLALVRQSTPVVRSNLRRNPFFRGPVVAAGFVTNEEGMALVDECKEHFAEKDTIVMFPQGTRTPENGEIVFRRGAANVAIRCKQTITPVSIRCEPRGLARYQKWYQVARRRMHFTIRVHDDLQVDPYLDPATPEPVAVRRLNADLERFFEQESGRATA